MTRKKRWIYVIKCMYVCACVYPIEAPQNQN